MVVGGDGTHRMAARLQKQGVNIVGVPKTIDNDILGTDRTFGFDSAVGVVGEAIDRLHHASAIALSLSMCPIRQLPIGR